MTRSRSLHTLCGRCSVAALLLSCAAAHAVCQPIVSRMTPIIRDLHSGSAGVRDSAYTRLLRLAPLLTVDESLEALYAATGEYAPVRTSIVVDARLELLYAASRHPVHEHLDAIRRLCGQYAVPLRAAAFELLGGLRDQYPKEAATLIVDLFLQFAPDAEVATASPDSTTSADAFGLESAMYRALFECLDRKILSPAQTARLEPVLIAACERYANMVRPFQGKRGITWMWEPAYQPSRESLALLLDMLGHLPARTSDSLLLKGLAFADPYLKVFALKSLLRRSIVAPSGEYTTVARNAHTRWILHEVLSDAGRLDLFPQAFLTQRALAESNMVNWLVYPTELGRQPDSIELMAVRSIKSTEGTEDYYFFRFRTNPPHWAARDGWMAGVSGPYLHGHAPTAHGGGDTFSTFVPWRPSYPDDYMKEK